MAMRYTIPFAFPILFGVLLTSTTYAQERKSLSCKVEITSVKTGDSVGLSQTIRGKATLPPGMHLWIFAHREGQAIWWPQGGGPARLNSTGDWVVLANFGEPRDSGANFEIRAVVIDKTANDKVADYVRMTEKEGRYPGTRLPAAGESGCTSSKDVVVERK
jgi:hypothetical protein